MGVYVMDTEVTFPIQASLEFHLHLQIGEPVAVLYGLGICAIVQLLGEDVTLVALSSHCADKLRILKFLSSVLRQATDIVERDTNVS